MVLDRRNMNELLKRYQNFKECIVIDFQVTNFGLTTYARVNYIWDQDGHLRKDLDQREEIVVLKFYLVQELVFFADLGPQMILSPEQINWGINEIAMITLVDDSDLEKKYSSLGRPFFHFRFWWEDERRIEIVAAEFEIVP